MIEKLKLIAASFVILLLAILPATAAVLAVGSTLRLSNTTTNIVESDTSAASASSTVAAFTLAPTANLDANDLVLEVNDSAGLQQFGVDEDGDVFARNDISAGAGGNLIGAGLQVGGGTFITDSLRCSLTVDVASIAAATCAETTCNIVGVPVNSPLACTFPAAIAAGLALSCFVSATDTVTFRLCNVTAIAVDPANGVYTARHFEG